MIVDTSVIMAILRDEPERAIFTDLLFHAGQAIMATASSVELTAVLVRGYPRLTDAAALLLDSASITLAPMSVAQAKIASDAYARFGRGTDHPAQLNFGDCFSYALAKAMDEPLLFKGDDFIHTDVRRAIDG